MIIHFHRTKHEDIIYLRDGKIVLITVPDIAEGVDYGIVDVMGGTLVEIEGIANIPDVITQDQLESIATVIMALLK